MKELSKSDSCDGRIQRHEGTAAYENAGLNKRQNSIEAAGYGSSF